MSLKNSHGFTITELLAAALLASVIAIGFATAMYQYVLSFQESRDFMNLQQDMVAAFDAMRHGFVRRNLNLDQPLIGFLSAQTITISPDKQSITIIPLDGRVGSRYFARFSRYARDGSIILNAQYGQYTGNNIVVFPSRDEKVGREAKYQITSLIFEDATPGIERSRLVRISMTGKVRFRERSSRQNQADDLKFNVRYAQFETTVFLGNADKE